MKRMLALALSLLCATSTFALPIKQIVIFGDSLSDNGNLYAYLRTVPKSPPYYEGRFTNGPVWSEHLANHYKEKGIETLNYAYGGATALFHSYPQANRVANPLNLDAEIYQYNVRNYFADRSQILYSIWIGSNDYLYASNEDIESLTTQVTQKISETINSLIEKGSKNFVVLNIPDLARTPYAFNHSSEAPRLHTFAVVHNKKLAEIIAAIRVANPDVNITEVDIFDKFTDLLDHPDKYNQMYNLSLNNIAEACWTGGINARQFAYPHLQQTILSDLSKGMVPNAETMSYAIANSPGLLQGYLVGKSFEDGEGPCADPDHHAFWDDIHPTGVVHKLVSQIAIDALTAQNPNL